MTIGPVQLVVLGFDEPRFTGKIRAELERLRGSDVVRVLDAFVIQKDADGTVLLVEEDDGQAPGDGDVSVAALIGLADADADESTAVLDPAAGRDDADTWTVDDVLSPGTAAVVALIEHRWAIGLRDAIRRVGGVHRADAWVHPEDLVMIGALAREDADELVR